MSIVFAPTQDIKFCVFGRLTIPLEFLTGHVALQRRVTRG